LEGIAVLGLGLLGGSLAAAATARGGVQRVIGYDRDPRHTQFALERGFVSDAQANPKAAVVGAQLVVVATPVPAMEEVVAAAAPGLAPGCVVTDLGSVKGRLAETLPPLLPKGVEYVGSHPMVGGHQSGVRHAREQLFEGAVVVVTGGPSAARDRIVDFWTRLGAQIELRSPREHDLEVAWTSHLPHVLAFAFAGAFGDAPESAKRLIGAGFRDFTRIARSDPQLWAGILSANASALARPLEQSAAVLEELAAALRSADGAKLEIILAKAGEELRGTPES
jgi:prephenate dehydrogenase